MTVVFDGELANETTVCINCLSAGAEVPEEEEGSRHIAQGQICSSHV